MLEYQPITVGNRKSLIVRALCKSERTGRLVVSPQLESGVELPPPRLPGALGGGRSDTRGGSAAQSRAKDRELIAAVTVSRLNS